VTAQRFSRWGQTSAVPGAVVESRCDQQGGLDGCTSCQRQLDVSAALLSQFHALAAPSIPVDLEDEQLCSGAAAAAHEPEGQGGGQQGRGSRSGAAEQHHVRVNTPTFMSHLEKREDCPRPAGFSLGGLFR